jgi:hypothetical protein
MYGATQYSRDFRMGAHSQAIVPSIFPKIRVTAEAQPSLGVSKEIPVREVLIDSAIAPPSTDPECFIHIALTKSSQR